MPKRGLKFAGRTQRLEHFRRHGASLRVISPTQYEARAARFLAGPAPAGVYEKSRTNGDLVRYNDVTEEFAVRTASGIIRTYFIPDPADHGFSSNLDYFHAQ